ncbi:hypothetical protein C0993_004634 [Termitomyces sp. T159_Od127]|nr:hypothetical protein C0993_004634 [Termitomyces sp. T159_Od127]
MSVKILGRVMIIVNSAQVLAELDKHGSIYSDRPRLEMGGELVGYKDTLVLARYGPYFRMLRKHFARHLGTPTIVEQHNTLVEYETRRFLRRTLADTTNLNDNLRRLAGGIIMQLTYGYEVQEGEDPFVTLIQGANDNFSAAIVPGAFLVDVFPALKYLPEWLPGMGFLALAREWAKATENMIEMPYNYTKQQMKAQAEIDAVIGRERLPTLADRPYLPYVNAVVTEVLRWNSVAPTGVAHTALEDGIIGGYLIPKGSIIIANLWNMLHDPEAYPEPFEFLPERHIATTDKPAQKNPRTICFGYGRRICPGMYLADASIFSLVASSLAVFNIKKAVENGVEITPIHENTSGIIR